MSGQPYIRQFAKAAVYAAIVGVTMLGIVSLFLPQLLTFEALSDTTIVGLRIIAISCFIGGGLLIVLHKKLQVWLQNFLVDLIELLTQLRGITWDKGAVLLLLLLTALALGVRLIYLNQPIRTDEAWTFMQYARQPLYLALSDYSAPNNHLFHTLAVFISTRIFGPHEWAIRLPAMLAGVLMVPASYLAMVNIFRRTSAALLGAGLVAASSVLIEYSTNARGYTIQALITVCLIAILPSLLRSQNRALWGLFSLLLALGFYTVPTMLYAFGFVAGGYILALFLFDIPQPRTQIVYLILACVAAGILTLLLYTPVLIVSGPSALIANQYVSPLDTTEWIERVSEMLQETISRWHDGLPLSLSVLFVAFFLVGALVQRRISVLVIPGLIWVTFLLFLQQVAPFTRIWLFLLPVYLSFVALGVAVLLKQLNADLYLRRSIALIITILCALVVIQSDRPYTSTETGTFRDAAPVTEFLGSRLKAGDKVIYEHPSGEALVYTFWRSSLPPESIERSFTAEQHLYVVLNTEYPQTIDSVLRENGLDRVLYGEPDLIFESEYARIYLIER